MLYFYLSLPILLLVAVTILFLYSMKSSGIPGKAQLIVDAWNSAGDSDRTADLAPNQEGDHRPIPSRGAVTNSLADISKFSYQN